MVHFVEKIKANSAIYQSAVAGAASGAITRAVAQPLDVVKIRFQLQIEPIKHGSKYSSTLQCFKAIIKEEGVAALWSGHVPAQLLSITYGVLQFTSFDKLTQLCQENNFQLYTSHRYWVNFSNGAIAASIATIVSFPFDTLRTRLIAEQKTKKAYRGFVHAFSTMVANEGTVSLFKGMVPTLGQIAPHAGIQFAVYKLLTESVFNKIGIFQRRNSVARGGESSLSANLLAGSISGFISKTAIYPFDVVKKRLQIQGFQEHRKNFGKQMYCNGLFECVKLTITEEGLLALYKGYGPSVLKAVLVSALHFAVYDEIKYLLSRS